MIDLPPPTSAQDNILTLSQIAPTTDRKATLPLWMQVKRALTGQINEQPMREHARLPSEAALCEHFKVSRTVVREALAQMVAEGLIYRLQGKGAFVRGPRQDQSFVSTTVGFSGELEEKSLSVTRRVLRQEITLPSDRMQRCLKVEARAPIVAIDRVLSVEGTPRAIVRWAMLAHLVPGLETRAMQAVSLYDTLLRQYGIKLTRAERWIEAVSLGPKEAKLLGTSRGKAALCVESLGFGPGQEAIEYYTALYLTDQARLRLVVAGSA